MSSLLYEDACLIAARLTQVKEKLPTNHGVLVKLWTSAVFHPTDGYQGPFSGVKTTFVAYAALGPAVYMCLWDLCVFLRRPCLTISFIFTGSYTEPDESNPHFTSFNSILVLYRLSALLPKQVCMHLSLPCMLHIPPISTSSVKWLMNCPPSSSSFIYQIFPRAPCSEELRGGGGGQVSHPYKTIRITTDEFKLT